MSKGMHCSQAMMLVMNELREIDNPDLVRASGGLGGGMFSGENCGALTGGACILGLFGARSAINDEPVYDYHTAIKELVKWFSAEFRSIECNDLALEESGERLEACKEIVVKTFNKCLEILDENGVDIYG